MNKLRVIVHKDVTKVSYCTHTFIYYINNVSRPFKCIIQGSFKPSNTNCNILFLSFLNVYYLNQHFIIFGSKS